MDKRFNEIFAISVITSAPAVVYWAGGGDLERGPMLGLVVAVTFVFFFAAVIAICVDE